MPITRSVTARVYDEERNWGNTLHHAAVTIDDDGSIRDIFYGSRWWRWSHTDAIGGDEIFVFVPRDSG